MDSSCYVGLILLLIFVPLGIYWWKRLMNKNRKVENQEKETPKEEQTVKEEILTYPDPKDVDLDKFSGTWDAQRLLATYIKNRNVFRKNPDRYGQIIIDQILSVMGGFKSYPTFYDTNESFVRNFEEGYYLSPEMTEEQKKEFFQIMRDWAPMDDYVKRGLESLPEVFELEPGVRAYYFRIFIQYRYEAQTMLNHFSGVMECSPSVVLSIFKVKSLYEPNLIEANKKLDRMLCLLMGAEFDREISEKQLITEYNYPAFTEKELKDIYYDNW